jgi:hypothetical protein
LGDCCNGATAYFVYKESLIATRLWHVSPEELYAVADVTVRMRNTGPATAYNPKFTIYYCWISNPSGIDRFVVDCQTHTRTNCYIDFPFHVDRTAVRLADDLHGKPTWGFDPKEQVFVWIEAESRGNAEDGPRCVEELERFYFIPVWAPPNLPRKLSFPNERLRGIAEPHFQKFREQEARHRTTQAELALNMAEPQPEQV